MNIVGVILSLVAVTWFVIRGASTHEEMRPGPPPLNPKYWTVKTGWPLPMLAGEVHHDSAEALLWLEQIPKTKYTSVLWAGLAVDLLAMLAVAVAFYSLSKHLTLLHLLAFTAFSGWFLSDNARLFDESFLPEATLVHLTREMTPLVVLVVCFNLPYTVLNVFSFGSRRNGETLANKALHDSSVDQSSVVN